MSLFRRTPIFGRKIEEEREAADFEMLKSMIDNDEDSSFFDNDEDDIKFQEDNIKTKSVDADENIENGFEDTPALGFRERYEASLKSSSTQEENKKEYRKNKASSTLKKIEQNLKAVRRGSLGEADCITADILLEAEEDFFDYYSDIADEIVTTVQQRLSEGGKAGTIAKLRDNPTDKEIRKEAFSSIFAEYIAYDNNPLRADYRTLNQTERSIIFTLVINQICGLGPLEPLYKDHKIREIICNGPKDVQVEIDGQIQVVRSCKFKDTAQLKDLISRLYNSVNKDVTRTNPFERARLHDNSRVFAVDTSVAPNGPNLNIRRHTDDWTDPQSLIDWGTASPELMEWLGGHINAGLSFLVNGGTATGKTTTLASLSGFLPNNKRVVTIEKNIELKLPKTKLVAAAMECIPRKNNNSSFEVTMRDLVECTTQMRPDIIICGEIVSDEAYDFIQAGNTGHQLGGTVHSNSSKACMIRLSSLISQAGLMVGKDTFELITNSLDLIVTLKRYPQDGSRKIIEIGEVGTSVALGENNIQYVPVNPIWKFIEDEIDNTPGAKITGRWEKVGELSKERAERHNIPLIKMKNLEELKALYGSEGR